MTVPEFIKHLQKMVKENPKLQKAKVTVEYQGSGGCETCGYGGETETDVDSGSIYDLDTRLVIHV